MAHAIHSLANPARFLRFARATLPWTSALTAGAFAVGLWLALWDSPIDYQQRDTVRIMYVHVPAAWLAMMAYTVLAVASATFLVWRHPLADLAGKACAPIGAMFTALALATGAIWGQPTWGTWWEWDARLTSVLVLLFLYLGYMALRGAFDDRQRGARASAILAIVGVVNLPIIKFSVDWWNTLHQPASVMRLGAPTIDPAMLTPLLVMALAFLAFFVTVMLIRIRAELAAAKIRTLQYARTRA